jgi:chromosome condensin MukBEF ATPase and DNA-binding subunit MukB
MTLSEDLLRMAMPGGADTARLHALFRKLLLGVLPSALPYADVNLDMDFCQQPMSMLSS